MPKSAVLASQSWMLGGAGRREGDVVLLLRVWGLTRAGCACTHHVSTHHDRVRAVVEHVVRKPSSLRCFSPRGVRDACLALVLKRSDTFPSQG
jgi:hypothetical protein